MSITPSAAGGTASLDRVLDTAADLFWAKGYAATTTREIAAALDIQQASLYYHVSSKEELLYQLCVSGLRQILSAVPAIPRTGPAIDRVRKLIRGHVTTLLGQKKRHAVMLMELRALTAKKRAEVVELRQQYADLVRTMLEEAQAEGSIRRDLSATHLMLALMNMLNWSVVWFHEDRELRADPLAEIFIKIYFDGVAVDRKEAELALANWTGPALKPVKPAAKGRKGSAETADRLMKAAVALFSRKGYDSTSTREVAALIGIQKASLYYHIQSKEDLLYLICKGSLERIRGDAESALKQTDAPLERIAVLMGAHLESMLRDLEEHATTLAEMRSLSQEKLTKVAAMRHEHDEMCRRVLQEGQRAGAVRTDIDAKYLSLAMLGLLNRVLVWYRKRGNLSPAELGRVLAKVYLEGVSA